MGIEKSRGFAYPHHIFQLTGYMYLLRKNKGLIAYIDKSSGEIYEYPVQLTDEDIEILKKQSQSHLCLITAKYRSAKPS